MPARGVVLEQESQSCLHFPKRRDGTTYKQATAASLLMKGLGRPCTETAPSQHGHDIPFQRRVPMGHGAMNLSGTRHQRHSSRPPDRSSCSDRHRANLWRNVDDNASLVVSHVPVTGPALFLSSELLVSVAKRADRNLCALGQRILPSLKRIEIVSLQSERREFRDTEDVRVFQFFPNPGGTRSNGRH